MLYPRSANTTSKFEKSLKSAKLIYCNEILSWSLSNFVWAFSIILGSTSIPLLYDVCFDVHDKVLAII